MIILKTSGSIYSGELYGKDVRILYRPSITIFLIRSNYIMQKVCKSQAIEASGEGGG